MCVAQCYIDKQMNKILVIALQTELCDIPSFGLKPIFKSSQSINRVKVQSGAAL